MQFKDIYYASLPQIAKNRFGIIFRSYIKDINKEASKSKKKILKVLYSLENPESMLEEYIEKNIDYQNYKNETF